MDIATAPDAFFDEMRVMLRASRMVHSWAPRSCASKLEAAAGRYYYYKQYAASIERLRAIADEQKRDDPADSYAWLVKWIEVLDHLQALRADYARQHGRAGIERDQFPANPDDLDDLDRNF